MTQPVGAAIASIEGGTASESGDAFLMITTLVGGTELVLSFPYLQLLSLIMVAAAGRTNCMLASGADPDADADVVAIRKLEFGTDARTGVAVIILTIANGGRLTYGLPSDIGEEMLQFILEMHGQGDLAGGPRRMH